MTSDAPGPATPGSGQPPEAGAAAGEWPVELVPPPAAPLNPALPTPAPMAPAPVSPAPATPTPAWGTPAAPVPAAPDAAPTPAWGAPATPTPAWGAPAAPAQPAPVPAPASWGAAPAAPPAPAPAPVAAPFPVPQQPQAWGTATPPPAGGWGAPPAGGPPAGVPPPVQGGQPGQWGAPPAGAAWAGGPGVPGGPPPGTWAPAPAKSSNGCLKACLIVGVILVVLGIIAVIGISILGAKLAEGLGVNPDGTMTSCQIISDQDLQKVLGSEATALPMGGIVDATLGQALDKRILPNAEDCMVAGGQGTATSGTTTAAGRIARQDGGDASGDFSKAKAAAETGGYLDTVNAVSGLGDEAFCTTIGDMASAGVLARSGSRLVYVSLIDTETLANGGTGNHACTVAQQIAALMLH